MGLFEEIKSYAPVNEQEEQDREVMLRFMERSKNYLERKNKVAHFTTSIWTVNRERTKTLLVYHNIYDSWTWIGGHADGEEDLRAVALRELREETGVKNAVLITPDLASLEILTVDGHVKRGVYVPSHLHLNLTYLAEGSESEELLVNPEENKGVKWWTFEEALQVSKEPWFVQRIYPKLIEKCKLF